MAGSMESDDLSDVPNHPKLCTTLEGLTQVVHVSLQHLLQPSYGWCYQSSYGSNEGWDDYASYGSQIYRIRG